MSLSRKLRKISHCYTLDGIPLARVRSVRDLGVLYDDHLSYNVHITSIVNTANTSLGFIFRFCKDFKCCRTLKILYTVKDPVPDHLRVTTAGF